MADSYAQDDEPLYDQAPGQYLHVTPDETVPAQFDNPLYFQKKGHEGQGDAGYLAVQQDWLSEQWDLLSAQPWFRGFQTREDASHELREKPPGTFVVRVSSSETGHYAISAIQHSGMDHMLILPSYAGPNSTAPGSTRYRLGTYSKDLFNTVPKLIAYYIDHEYIDVRRLQGEVVEEDQPGGYMDVNPTPVGSWNQGEISRGEAEAQLRGQRPGAFVLRTKRGAGYVLSMAVPPPKGSMHHLITVEEGQFVIDGVPVGAYNSIEELIQTLQEDTLSCISTPLINIFADAPLGAAAFDEPQYDTAGEAGAAPGGRLYDAVPGEDVTGYNVGDDLDPLYDEAETDTGYLGVEPAGDPYPAPVAYNTSPGDDPLYSEEAYGAQLDPLADDYGAEGPYGTQAEVAAAAAADPIVNSNSLYGDPEHYGDPDVDEDL
mmetsp:Transcript_897/g.2659  ORF Transcript_897/g.2659 Transcript_897/m.2659 type:complete len:431 (+) Transcript_897:211-1503(+)